jgi:Glycosyl hydrolase family 65 central catalytic domain
LVTGNKASRIAVTTLVSEDPTHLAATRLSITPEFSGPIRLRFTLRPHPAPAHRILAGTLAGKRLEAAIAAASPDPGLKSNTASDRAVLWYPGEMKVEAFGGNLSQNLMWILGRAVKGLELAEATVVELPAGLNPTEKTLHPSAQLVELAVTANVEKGKTRTFTKYVGVSRKGWGGMNSDVIRRAEAARREGFASLLAKNQAQWHKLWKADITVEGDPQVQRAIHSDLFNLLENSTMGTAWAMEGCGLSPCYFGHVFWDNDSWDFPALVLLHRARAKSLEMFRYRTLPSAEARAKERGYQGGMYPWDSDPEKGTDVTPMLAQAFSDREIHVNADVAIAQWDYYLATGDVERLRQYGDRVIHEMADFWLSRSTYNRAKDRYEILHVTSLDEAYNNVPNDAFNNAVAQKALRVATAAAHILNIPPDPKWAEVARKMDIPFSERELRHLDFNEAVSHDKKTWMGSSLSWLSYPPLDLAMSKEVRLNDFNFAIKSLSELTPDANDMVPVMVGIEAAELGKEVESYIWLKFSMGGFLKPPFNMRSETARNNAIYNLSVSAGFLENFLYGFTGLRFTDAGLSQVYPPVLPSAFKSVTLGNISLRNRKHDLILSRDATGKVQLVKPPSNN